MRRAHRVVGYALASALLGSLLAQPGFAQTPAPAASAVAAAPAKPLRHLLFNVAVDLSTATEMLGTKAVDSNFGASAEHYELSGNTHGTITCDVAGVSAEGNLIVDVTEDVPERANALVRVGLQHDGGIVGFPGQRTLSEEEAELVALLAPGLFGSEERAVGDSWTFRQSGPNYTATKTFRLADIKGDDDTLLNVDETYRTTGTQPTTGTIQGTVHYDPSRLVPTHANLDKTTRQETIDRYVTRKVAMHFDLKDDSRARH